MNIIKAKVSIRGIRPLLQHRFTEAALPLEKVERTGVAGNDPEEWRKTAMVNKEGQLFLEPSYVFSTLRNASRFTRKGKGSVQSDVSATLQVVDEIVLLDRFYPTFPNGKKCDISEVEPPPRDADMPVFLHVQPVKNPTTKARNIRYRLACSPGWKVGFTILWDKTIVGTSQMKDIVRDAGVLVGLADGRSIGFGRFEVDDFKLIE